jgi:hypothetical protein
VGISEYLLFILSMETDCLSQIDITKEKSTEGFNKKTTGWAKDVWLRWYSTCLASAMP